MTSEAKIAANRRNAQRSTGPRTALGKAHVRRNALQHGLAAVVVADPAVAVEVDRIAATLFSPKVSSLEREQALVIGEAQVTLKRVRKARTNIMERMLSTPALDAHAGASFGQLLRLERYERRALSRRKRAVRASFCVS
jgi:hypothetical protein